MFLHLAVVLRALSFHKRSLYPRLRAGGTRRKLLVFLVLVVGAVFVLPYIIAKTTLRNALLSNAVPNGIVRLSASDASLSWISPPSLSGFEAVDATGAQLITAERISADRTPLGLLLDSHNLGVVEIAQPTIHLTVRADGSNLEDVINAVLATFTPTDQPQPPDAAAGPSTTFAINILEATVLIDDTVTNRQWRVEGVNILYDNRTPNAALGRASISGRVVQLAQASAPIPAGTFSISLQPIDGGRNQLLLQADALSLAVLEPFLHRFATGSQLNGTLAGQGSATWTQPATGTPITGLTTSGNLAIHQLDATAAALEGDHIRLARVELPWQISSQQGAWAIENLDLRCDAARIKAQGQLDPNFTTGRHNVEVTGAVDVARLAAMLPRALRIREGTTIQSGVIELTAQYRPNDAGQIITGSVRAKQFEGTNAGKTLRWEQPVHASFTARRTADSLQLDALKCDSEFLNIEAAGTPQQFAASASFDLNKLAEQLGQFIDLSGVQLAGTGTANLELKQPASNQFSASATGDLTQLAVSLGDGGTWSEPQLALRAELAGLLDPASGKPSRLDMAKLQVNGQGDLLDAQLTSAVMLTDAAPSFPVTVKASGRIARWLTRVRPWFAPDPWQVDGQSELSAVLRVAAGAIDATQVNLVVNGLRATAPGWNINEPLVKFIGDAHWNGETGEIASDTSQFVTSTLSIATQGVRYRAGNNAINQLTGAAAFRADLARLAAWQATTEQPSYRPQGELTGNIRFAQQADRITAELNANGKNLALYALTPTASRGVPAPGPLGPQSIWQEPALTLRAVANYDSPTDRLALDEFQIQSTTLQAAGTGTIDKLSTAADVNLNGTVGYDLAQITPLLQPYLGPGVRLTGKEQARFAMAGKLTSSTAPQVQFASLAPAATPHWSRRLKAQLELPWGGADVYGLPVGPGRLAAALGDGAIRIEPLSLAVGDGTLTAAPHVRFDPAPSELTLPPGPLITNVRISPEVSEAMLKYIAPVLAGATQSEGQFSMHLDGTRVPLADAKKADIAGKLSVHSVRVVPGAMANEFINLARQIEALAKRRDSSLLSSTLGGGVGGGAAQQLTLLNIRDQEVNFKVLEGRVHHQNLEFQVNDVTLRSQGSVGFDQTIQLTLLVPIKDEWIAKEPLLAGFKGQALQVPVGGTLARPQIDGRAIASLTQQLLQGAAQQAIGGELNKALDKIFKPR